MARPQSGVAHPSQKYGLSVRYQIKDVPTHAMTIAHLGAMIPGLAAEIGGVNSSPRVDYLVGFGSVLGSFIWQGNQPRGFDRLNSLEKEKVFQPHTDGDFLIFVSSHSLEINHKLEECVQSYLSKLVIKKDLIEGKMGDILYTAESRDRMLIDASDPEFNQSCFVWLRGIENMEGVGNVPTGIDAHEKEGTSLNSIGVISHRMYYELEGKNCFLEFSFAPIPELFKNVFQDQELSLKQNFQYLSKGFFFLPSVEVLVSSRMGTLRMGSLSPTAKWKER